VGHEGVRDEAKGGAPLMGGAHNTCQVTTQWFGSERGVRKRRGRELGERGMSMREGRHLGSE
jgi:hypothetical protein